jgi:hypothetical protein
VQRSHDARAAQREFALVFVTDRHQSGHLLLGEANLLPPELGERQVANLEWRTVCGLLLLDQLGDAH